jgi:hypothetical protein
MVAAQGCPKQQMQINVITIAIGTKIIIEIITIGIIIRIRVTIGLTVTKGSHTKQ